MARTPPLALQTLVALLPVVPRALLLLVPLLEEPQLEGRQPVEAAVPQLGRPLLVELLLLRLVLQVATLAQAPALQVPDNPTQLLAVLPLLAVLLLRVQAARLETTPLPSAHPSPPLEATSLRMSARTHLHSLVPRRRLISFGSRPARHLLSWLVLLLGGCNGWFDVWGRRSGVCVILLKGLLGIVRSIHVVYHRYYERAKYAWGGRGREWLATAQNIDQGVRDMSCIKKIIAEKKSAFAIKGASLFLAFTR